MPENKKHHYVPRFYLKRWSTTGKSIGVLNVTSGRLVENGNLRNQCYRDYFYGKDPKLEKTLGTLEGQCALLFSMIEEAGCLPPPGSDEHPVFLIFLLLQLRRTRYAADELNEMYDKMTKAAFRDYLLEKEAFDINELRIGMENASLFSLSLALDAWPMLSDLSYKLLVNDTKKDFVVSDVPVVEINPLLSFVTIGGTTGFATKGLIMFYPISPRLQAILFDSNVYSVGHPRKHTVAITLERDVEQINIMQAAACYENIYFRTENFGAKKLLRASRKFRRKQKANVNVFPKNFGPGRQREQIIMNYSEDLKFRPRLSFLGIRKSAKEWREATRRRKLQPAHFPRNEHLHRMYEGFQQAVTDGRYLRQDFFKYVKENPDNI